MDGRIKERNNLKMGEKKRKGKKQKIFQLLQISLVDNRLYIRFGYLTTFGLECKNIQ